MNFTDLDLSLDSVSVQYASALGAYSEKHRRHHDKQCLDIMFEGLEKMRSWLVANNYTQREVDLIKAAVVYSKVVYEPCQKRNEIESSELFVAHSKSNGWFNHKDTEIVANSILVSAPTYAHDCAPFKGALNDTYTIASVFCDVSLYHFSLPPELFFTRLRKLVRECLGSAELNRGFYLCFLEHLSTYLSRKNLYSTDYAITHWQKKAYKNIYMLASEYSKEISDEF